MTLLDPVQGHPPVLHSIAAMGTEAPAPGQVSLLLVEDDRTIGRHLEIGLIGHGYHVSWARTGGSALAMAGATPPSVALVDLGLPDIDGVEIVRTLRAEHPQLLLVILTARSEEIDIVVGLDAGADDYLVKPFTVTVLLARLRAHLRRRSTSTSAATDPIVIGDLVLDVAARRCLLGGVEVALRPKEFELLVVLASRPGIAVSREQLMDQVWDENWFGSTKTLDVTMAALRKRLTQAADHHLSAQAPTITTLRRHGYRLELPSSRRI